MDARAEPSAGEAEVGKEKGKRKVITKGMKVEVGSAKEVKLCVCYAERGA